MVNCSISCIHGECIEKWNGHKCLCDPFWSGENCDSIWKFLICTAVFFTGFFGILATLSCTFGNDASNVFRNNPDGEDCDAWRPKDPKYDLAQDKDVRDQIENVRKDAILELKKITI
ncbi:Oidioi.mRNA.OKI2018_I69.chr2.g4524.t2.cds [Oikopleura dioica]|uniref:Oidioi.mRNA.OKI2018_I69.chr2.g4524.t2.cds n=1 Tax=Oikopleura dioica TaxID=34765 RepID=A0ABN7SY17_OIKDI|nr:Oidioi.mRNA.OKI2018_I69.chr2.g4524.t2.cds [Oikopleura dioica]